MRYHPDYLAHLEEAERILRGGVPALLDYFGPIYLLTPEEAEERIERDYQAILKTRGKGVEELIDWEVEDG